MYEELGRARNVFDREMLYITDHGRERKDVVFMKFICEWEGALLPSVSGDTCEQVSNSNHLIPVGCQVGFGTLMLTGMM